MNPTTNSQRIAVNLISGQPRTLNRFIVGEALDDGWLVVLTFQVGNGATDLVAHLVMPRPADWGDDVKHDTKWLTAMSNVLSWNAPSRLTNAVVRSAKATPLERWARSYIASLEGFMPGFPIGVAGGGFRPRGPVPQRQEQRHLMYAARYVELCNDPEIATPVEALATERGMARNTVQNYLYKARHEFGLLTTRGRGVAGGELTPKAKTLLAAMIEKGTST